MTAAFFGPEATSVAFTKHLLERLLVRVAEEFKISTFQEWGRYAIAYG
jgi:hypothetical protein